MPPRFRFVLGAAGLFVLTYASLAQAQVRPDRTTNTQRFGDCAVYCDIQGGIESDRNLFHSFKAFSIPRDGEVYFSFPYRIRNLFVRVTGQQESRLNGLLFTPGTANVFLMNPNGIIVSENASINVGGSFTATTADAIAFGELGVFDTRNLGQSTDPQLLSVDPSAFFFHDTPAPIRVNAPTAGAVQVFGNSTLLLLGGHITLDNSFLYGSSGGSIQLASIGEAGSVELSMRSPLYDLTIPEDLTRADITITDSRIDVRSFSQGEIFIFGKNVFLVNSVLLAGIDSGFEGAVGGDMILSATDTLSLDGFSILGNNIFPGATGSTGDVLISANTFELLGGSQISTSTFGVGDAGSVVVDVGDHALLEGATLDGEFASAILSEVSQGAIGDGGNILIRANDLQVLNGAQLSTATDSQGNAGDIHIDVQDQVIFDGRSPGREYASIAFSNVRYTGVGNGGNIRIEADNLSLLNGASLVTSTDGIGDAGEINIRVEDTAIFSGTTRVFGDEVTGVINSGIFNRVETYGIGDAGDTRIHAEQIIIADDARITSATLGDGNAGNITIRSQDSVWMDGGRVQTNSSTNFSGRGGDIYIGTDQLTLIDNAQILSASEGIDQAGDIVLNARHIELDTGAIYAATTSQDGGDLTIENADLLLLRNNSLLATTAGLDEEGGGGNGGNIAIDSDLVVAVPIENSNISADAFDGNGGNVDILTQGIYGIEFRESLTPLSDITASSEFGVDGIVTISNPAIDPTSGLIELPSDFIDASAQLRQDCASQPGRSANASPGSEFILTGRGGLPTAPEDTGSRTAIQSSWVTIPAEQSATQPPSSLAASETEVAPDASLLEAQAWAVDEQGQVVLTAQAAVDPTRPLRCMP